MTTILAIDLGKYKSTVCEYLPEENTHTVEQLRMHPARLIAHLDHYALRRVAFNEVVHRLRLRGQLL